MEIETEAAAKTEIETLNKNKANVLRSVLNYGSVGKVPCLVIER